MIGFTERFNPTIVAMHNLPRETKDEIVCCIRRNITTNSSNIVLDTMIHDIDITYGIAERSGSLKRFESDNWEVSFASENSVIVNCGRYSIHAERLAPQKVRSISEMGLDYGIVARPLENKIEFTQSELTQDIKAGGPEPLVGQLNYFIENCIEYGGEHNARRDYEVHMIAYDIMKAMEEYVSNH